MAQINPANIAFMMSNPGGTAGGQTPSPSVVAGGSLGKYVANQAVSTAQSGLNNLFTNISGANNAAGAIDYQCIFVQNSDPNTTGMLNVAVYLSGSAPTATIAVAWDTIAVSAISSSSAQAQVIGSASVAPAGISGWTAPSAGSPLYVTGTPSTSTLGPNQVKALWLRRTATNSGAVNNDGTTLNIQFDTTA